MKYSLRRRNRDVFIFELVVESHGKISRPRRNSTLQRQKNMPKRPFSNTCYIMLQFFDTIKFIRICFPNLLR